MGNTESSPEELAKTKGGGESFNSLRTGFATKSNEKADWSTYDNDDSSVEFILDSDDGQKRLQDLKDSVGADLKEKYPELVNFICTASLVFRNGDMNTVLNEYKIITWRQKYLGTYEKIILENEPEILEIYNRNLFNVIENVDAEGRCAVYIRLKYMDPTKISPLSVLKTFHYSVMERIMKDHPICQKKGIYMIGDMGEAGFNNLDQRVPKAIMGAISKNFLYVCIEIMVRPIWILNIIFPIVRLFLSAKLQDRIKIVGNDPKLLKDYDLSMINYLKYLVRTIRHMIFKNVQRNGLRRKKFIVKTNNDSNNK